MKTRMLTATLAAAGVAVTVVATLSAAPDARAPRIVAATMQDTDRDSHADRMRLTYSERVRHAADRDGKYPFRVAGYRIQAVGKASSRTIVLALAELAAVDDTAKPTVRYARTRPPPSPPRPRPRRRATATTTGSSMSRTADRRIRRSSRARRTSPI
jgi:hypothetical protein